MTLTDTSPHASRTKGFTLVELLVVIAIIAALASLSFVGAGKVMKSGKKTQSMSLMRSLEKAVLDYHADYSKFPPNNVGSSIWWEGQQWTNVNNTKDFLRPLCGQDTVNNPNDEVYLEAPQAKGGDAYGVGSKNGLNYNPDNGLVSGMRDAFGNGVALHLDANYDGVIKIPGSYVATGGNADIRKKVLIYSSGADGTGFTADDLKSW